MNCMQTSRKKLAGADLKVVDAHPVVSFFLDRLFLRGQGRMAALHLFARLPGGPSVRGRAPDDTSYIGLDY